MFSRKKKRLVLRICVVLFVCAVCGYFFGRSPNVASSNAIATSFSYDSLSKLAAEMAKGDYVAPKPLPDALKTLSYDQWRQIRFNTEQSLWRKEKLPFELQFFHQGFNFDRSVGVNVVSGGRSTPLSFSPKFFQYPADVERPDLVTAGSGFAGFRIHYPLNSKKYKDEIAVFLGASYFRSLGRDTQYGLSARGIALDTGLPSGEEFPWFREFWIQKPEQGDKSVTVYALLDSQSCTGAYRFVITPGDETKIAADCRLYFRRTIQKVGVAPLTSMFFFGETDNGRHGDYRPEVHDSDGLLVLTGDDQWIWRPLQNGERLLLSRIPQKGGAKIKGFGLLQRDREFDHYQDLEAHYDNRPSLWIEPKGEWGPGSVELVEIPSDSEYNDNMVAYWVSDTPLEKRKKVEFSYVMKWGKHEQEIHPLARATATRRAAGDHEGLVRFVIDFEGGGLDKLPKDAGLSSIIDVEGAKVTQKHLEKNPQSGGWRLSFQLEPDEKKSGLPSLQTPSSTVSVSAYLKKGENFAEPLTETWTYTFSR